MSRAPGYHDRMDEAPPIRPMSERFRGYLPVVVDVETGGFDWNRHALLEIAAVPVELDEAGRFVPGEVACAHLEPAPGTVIDPKSLEITGIVLDHPFRMAKPEKAALDHVFAAVRAAVKRHACQRAILVGAHRTEVSQLRGIGRTGLRNKIEAFLEKQPGPAPTNCWSA